jgi:HAD superfamily hydrolase (TIGR01549 family)
MKFEDIRCVSFDVGNTLLDISNGGGFCSLFAKIVGMNTTELFPVFAEYFLTIDEPMQNAVEKACDAINYNNPESIVAAYKSVPIKLFDDVKPVMRVLRERHLYIITVSNCTPWESSSLKDMGLEDYVDRAFYSFEVGYAKPDNCYYEYIEKETGFKGKHILHVGDSLNADILGARSAGWNAVLLKRTGIISTETEDAGVTTARDLFELADML